MCIEVPPCVEAYHGRAGARKMYGPPSMSKPESGGTTVCENVFGLSMGHFRPRATMGHPRAPVLENGPVSRTAFFCQSQLTQWRWENYDGLCSGAETRAVWGAMSEHGPCDP